MAKFIEMVRLITGEEEVEFQNAVAREVGNMHRAGYEVDIDFKPMQGGFSALITAYKTHQNSKKFAQLFEEIVKQQQEQEKQRKELQEIQEKYENGEITEEELADMGLQVVRPEGETQPEPQEESKEEKKKTKKK